MGKRHFDINVRVLRLTDDKQGYENLQNCLVLPVKGPRLMRLNVPGGPWAVTSSLSAGITNLFQKWWNKEIFWNSQVYGPPSLAYAAEVALN